jgi:hypothetical protein
MLERLAGMTGLAQHLAQKRAPATRGGANEVRLQLAGYLEVRSETKVN